MMFIHSFECFDVHVYDLMMSSFHLIINPQLNQYQNDKIIVTLDFLFWLKVTLTFKFDLTLS